MRERADHSMWEGADRRRSQNLYYLYGVTLSEFNSILEAQGGACAVCEKLSHKYVIDHSHACCPGIRSCGECVRGVICHSCNTALGAVEDDADTLRKLIKYLNC